MTGKSTHETAAQGPEWGPECDTGWDTELDTEKVTPAPGFLRETARFAGLTVLGVLLSGLISDGPSAAARTLPAQNPEAVQSARVTAIVDGDTVKLDTGAEVRLTGIQAPKLPLGRKGFRPWPLAAKARAALTALSRDRQVRLDYTGRRHDRWGRLLAHLHVGETWLQREMLLRGLARVYTFPDNRTHAAALYAAEQTARIAGRGIWALNWYRILPVADTDRYIGTFQLVEGAVVSTAIVRGRGYLNFGADWQTDFTISIAPKHMKLFRAAQVDIMALRDRRLRVRGWLVRRNGAMISVTHPEQIEFLTREANPAKPTQ
jgi:micrococcal nuclease